MFPELPGTERGLGSSRPKCSSSAVLCWESGNSGNSGNFLLGSARKNRNFFEAGGTGHEDPCAPPLNAQRSVRPRQKNNSFYAPGLPKSSPSCQGMRMFTKVATVFMNAATAEQSCKALSLRLPGTPPRGAVYPAGV